MSSHCLLPVSSHIVGLLTTRVGDINIWCQANRYEGWHERIRTALHRIGMETSCVSGLV